MKKILPFTFLFIFNFCLGQEKPIVKFASTTSIVGNCNYGSNVYYTYKDTNGIEKEESVEVTNGNNFVITFKLLQTVGYKGKIWSTYMKYKISKTTTDKEDYTIINDTDVVKIVTTSAKKNEYNYIDEVDKINEFKAEKEALKNTTLTYGAQVLSTNFTIPIARFNFVKNDTQKQGDILLFTSIGAGVGYYWGQLERTRDNTGEIINEEFRNRLGVNLGFLFSAGTGEDTKNVFAPVINFAVLDFQIGVGVELGTRSINQKKEFLTISYAIPIYKLFKKGYKLYAIELEPNELIQKSIN